MCFKFALIYLAVEFLPAAGCPGNRAVNGFGLGGGSFFHVSAVIQANHDIRPKTDLKLDSFFRGEQVFPLTVHRAE